MPRVTVSSRRLSRATELSSASTKMHFSACRCTRHPPTHSYRNSQGHLSSLPLLLCTMNIRQHILHTSPGCKPPDQRLHLVLASNMYKYTSPALPYRQPRITLMRPAPVQVHVVQMPILGPAWRYLHHVIEPVCPARNIGNGNGGKDRIFLTFASHKKKTKQ